MASVTLIIGGARSGKSSYASRLALAVSKRPVYVATARIFPDDEEFEARVALHRRDRGDAFEFVEEQRVLSAHVDVFRGKAVVIDCLTLWLTSFYLDAGNDAGAALEQAKAEFDKLAAQWDATLFIVTNELGSGVHAETKMGRDFVDIQGWLNQHCARAANRVVLMVAGQPMQVKPSAFDSMAIPPVPRPAVRSAECAQEAAVIDTVLSTRKTVMDSNGYFILRAAPREQQIVAEFYSSKTDADGSVVDPVTGERIKCYDVREPTSVFRARTAKQMQARLFEASDTAGLIQSLGHACYLGRELQRVEHALATGTEYVMD